MRLLISLFSPLTDAWGGLTRAVAIAQAADRAGHEVAFCASGYLETSLSQRGYRVYPAPPVTVFGLPARITQVLGLRSQEASARIRSSLSVSNWWMAMVLSGMARVDYLRRLVQAEMEALGDFGADVLLTDGDPGAYLLAVVTGLPLASTYANVVTLGIDSWSWRLMRRATTSTLAYYGQPFHAPDKLYFDASILKIIPSIPELDGTDPDRSDIRYVGHLLSDIDIEDPGDWQPEPDQPYVFVYVGTGTIGLDKLEKVLSQVFPAGGELRCLVGVRGIRQSYRLNDVEFRPYFPAEVVLAQCEWTLCHGGQNTVIRSLRQDVPLILFPGPVFERRFNARKTWEAGAAVLGELNQFTPVWIEQAMTRRAECVPHAAQLGERIRAYGGAQAAIEAIAGWVR
ncbi:MAG: hypothetical protein JXB30_18665 [Anaerolineae bacterium]|nr:hypothetical protein [Anaerolineae bacterium]